MVPTAYDAACRDEEAQTNKFNKNPKTEKFSSPIPPPKTHHLHAIIRGNKLTDPQQKVIESTESKAKKH